MLGGESGSVRDYETKINVSISRDVCFFSRECGVRGFGIYVDEG